MHLKSNIAARIRQPEIMSLEDYLIGCKTNPLWYATAAERMVAAIGEPTVFDTSTDPRMSRIFSNRKIRVYDAFKDFFGAEDAIEQIATYFRNAAAGLEESKQILYLLGPVGGGKSSLAERIKDLMEVHPIFVLYDRNENDPELRMSPVFESPLSLFSVSEHGELFEQEFGIGSSYLGKTVLSGWAQEKLREFDGDITKFSVAKVYPSKASQTAIMKIEPGDDNNQDVSVLVGKTDLRKLDRFSQNHPYSYSYSGGLNRTNQGLMEFAEMFKANLKVLNPLLMATQDRSYNGTESIPSMPYGGIVLSHSNQSEWTNFRNNKTNEAFLDRVCVIKVPYCLRVNEEEQIYQKMLKGSTMRNAPIAPQTLKMLAQFMVLTRLVEPSNSTMNAKMRVYNGEAVKDTMPNAKPIEEYRMAAGVEEGMSGMSTRFAFKIISKCLDLRPDERQANPVDLMFVLEEAIRLEHLPEETSKRYNYFIREYLHRDYFTFLEKELRAAYLDSSDTFGQNMFERYVLFAEAWLDDTQCRDPETHVLLNRSQLNEQLEAIERPASVMNVKDFRHEIVNYVLRYRAKNGGDAPRWSEYTKIKDVIEKKMFAATENIMPVISFGPKSSDELATKHNKFIERMVERGYTENQIQLLVAWWTANAKT
jgi:serine protein kinase